MTIDQATEELKKINRGLYIEPRESEIGQYYAIMHKDDRTGLVRNVFEVLTDDGKPKAIEMSELRRVARGIDWEAVAKHKEPEAIYNAWLKEYNYRKAKNKLESRGIVTDIINDRRKYWKEAFEEFRNSLTPSQIRAMKRDHERKEYIKEQRKKGKLITGV